MMIGKKISGLAFVSALFLVLLLPVSCLEDGDETLVLPDSQQMIPSDVIPDSVQYALTGHGFHIYTGSKPPQMEGSFKLSPLELLYASDNYHISDFSDLIVSFSDQQSRGMLKYRECQNDTVVGKSVQARVIGTGDYFTVYCIQYVAGPSGSWRCKIATLISGKVTSQGLRDCQYAFVMLERESASPTTDPSLAEEGTVRIFVDGDGLGVRVGK